jgi:hypothetical protein
LKQSSASQLLFGIDKHRQAFYSYHQLLYIYCTAVPGRGNSNSPPAAILLLCRQYGAFDKIEILGDKKLGETALQMISVMA